MSASKVIKTFLSSPAMKVRHSIYWGFKNKKQKQYSKIGSNDNAKAKQQKIILAKNKCEHWQKSIMLGG